jgi:hypothetical protein
MVRHLERAVHQGAQAFAPQRHQAEPELEAAEGPRALEGVVVEVHAIRLRVEALAQVAGVGSKAAPERPAIAHEQAAQAERLEQPLVRVDGHGVGALDAAQQAAVAPGEQQRAAVGGVDVVVGARAAREAPERSQRIDHAGVGRAGGRDHRHRPQPASAAGLERGGERVRRELVARVGRNAHQRALAESQHVQRPLDREVRLLRGVDAQEPRGGPQPARPRAVPQRAVARHLHGDQVGDAAAAGQHAEGVRTEPDQVVQPADQAQLDLRGGGGGLPGVERLVEERRRQLRQRRERQRGGAEQPEHARMRHLHRMAEERPAQVPHQPRGVAARFRQRPVEQPFELRHTRAAEGPARAPAEDVGEGLVEDEAAEALNAPAFARPGGVLRCRPLADRPTKLRHRCRSLTLQPSWLDDAGVCVRRAKRSVSTCARRRIHSAAARSTKHHAERSAPHPRARQRQ